MKSFLFVNHLKASFLYFTPLNVLLIKRKTKLHKNNQVLIKEPMLKKINCEKQTPYFAVTAPLFAKVSYLSVAY